jgi:hypothetical protein
MGKGRQQAPGDQVVRQTNLPEYADPYFRRLLQGAEEALCRLARIDPETGRCLDHTAYIHTISG